MMRQKKRESRKTYNTLRADILRPFDVKFGMTGIGLPSKILYFKHTLRANKQKKKRET